jgi:hypothetical protein
VLRLVSVCTSIPALMCRADCSYGGLQGRRENQWDPSFSVGPTPVIAALIQDSPLQSLTLNAVTMPTKFQHELGRGHSCHRIVPQRSTALPHLDVTP